MKKFLSLLTVMVCALNVSAQVAFLKVEETLPDYGEQQPEQNAYEWFKTTYGDANVVDMNHIPADVSTYKVLWVNVERNITETAFDELFTESIRTALSNYVQAGGNLLLTKKASRLACHIGRMGVRENGMYYPTWNNSEYSVGNDTWTINAMIGAGATLRDARQHPIFEGMTKGSYNDYAHESFPLIGQVNRSDNNCIWIEMETKGGGDTPNDNIATLNNFQSAWNCQVLAVWGHVRNYVAPVIIEFFPDNTYKGTIITIGSNAYQWGSSNTGDPLENVKKLTSNALNYLAAGGDEYGYYMPYTLSEIYSIDQYKPEYNAAKWFYDHYIDPNRTLENNYGNGRFIHKEEAIPAGMKVLWVHGDRNGQSTEDFYTAFGGNDFKTKLQDFVQAGGNVFLSKQATRFAHDMGRCSWNPSYINSAYHDGNDTWYMVSNFVAVGTGVDRHNHRAFHYMKDYTEHMKNETESEGSCKWPLVSGVGTYKRSDHKYMWGEPGDTWNNTYHISYSSTQIERLNEFETAQTCRILGGWGHTTALDGAGMVEFLPTSTYKGTIIAQGLPAYQWTSTNTSISNVQNLTQGVLEYLNTADTYTREELEPGTYYTICLPRAAKSYTGGVMHRLADKTAENGIVIEEVEGMEAGTPYIFRATETTLRVNYTGATEGAKRVNGLVGYIGDNPSTLTEDENHYILAYNKIWQVDESIELPSNRAYIYMSDINSTPQAPGRRRYVLSGNAIVTGFDPTEVHTADEVRKQIRHGQFQIIRGNEVFNALGQKH